MNYTYQFRIYQHGQAPYEVSQGGINASQAKDIVMRREHSDFWNTHWIGTEKSKSSSSSGDIGVGGVVVLLILALFVGVFGENSNKEQQQQQQSSVIEFVKKG